MNVPYWRYEESFKAIHSALSNLMAPPSGQKITKLTFSWNVNGTLATLNAYNNAILLFTLAFDWNADGTLKEVSRADA